MLSLRPIERRHLIEEAADVHRHRIELTRAERRIGQTRDNLGHVRVLVRELAPRLRQLERQSERAARHRALEGQLTAALEAYYEVELRRARDAHAAAQASHDQRAEAFAAARRAAEAFAPQIAAAERAVAEARAELDRTQRRERERAEQALALGQQLALSEQRRELLELRSGELASSIAELEAAPEAWAADEGRDGRARGARRGGGDGARGRAGGAAHRRFRPCARCCASWRRRRRGARASRPSWPTSSVAASMRRRGARRASASARPPSPAAASCSRRSRTTAGGRWPRRASASGWRRPARRRSAAARSRSGAWEGSQRAAADARESLRDVTAERDGLTARRDLIATLSARVADRGSAAQELLRAAYEPAEGDEPLPGVVGLVSRLIRVPKGLELAIEAALADQIGAVVVERQEDALAAIEHLRERGAGTATLLPRDAMPHQYPLNLFNERGVVGVAARLVKVDKEHRALIDSLLGRTIVVDDLPTALKNVNRGLGSVVTRDGVLLRPNGSFYGGSRGAGAEQFELHEEAAELPQAIATAERAADSSAARVQRLDDAVADGRDAGRADPPRRRGSGGAAPRARARDGAAAAPTGRTRRRAAASSMPRWRPTPTTARTAWAARRRARPPRGCAPRSRPWTGGSPARGTAPRPSAASATPRPRRSQRPPPGLAGARGERDAAESRRAAAEAERRLARERLAERREQALAVERELQDLALTVRDLSEQRANVQAARGTAEAAVAPAHAALAEAEAAERELAATRGDSQARLFAAERELLEAQSTLRERATRVQTLDQQLADDGLVADEAGGMRRENGARPEAELAAVASVEGAPARPAVVALATWRRRGLAAGAARPRRRAARRAARARAGQPRGGRGPERGARAPRLPGRAAGGPGGGGAAAARGHHGPRAPRP